MSTGENKTDAKSVEALESACMGSRRRIVKSAVVAVYAITEGANIGVKSVAAPESARMGRRRASVKSVEDRAFVIMEE